MSNLIEIVRYPDGTLTNFSRHHTINGKRGYGGLVIYVGEAAEVMKLVLKYSDNKSLEEK